MRDDDCWAVRGDGGEVPLAALSDEGKRPRRRVPRSRRWGAAALVVALGAAGGTHFTRLVSIVDAGVGHTGPLSSGALSGKGFFSAFTSWTCASPASPDVSSPLQPAQTKAMNGI